MTKIKMRNIFITIVLLIISYTNGNAQIKILFDATKAEAAGNADWVIDADQTILVFLMDQHRLEEQNRMHNEFLRPYKLPLQAHLVKQHGREEFQRGELIA
jgi:hypothetical protein